MFAKIGCSFSSRGKCTVFRQLTPREGETARKFKVCLRKQTRHCNFGTTLEENFRDQLIEKLPGVELGSYRKSIILLCKLQ